MSSAHFLLILFDSIGGQRKQKRSEIITLLGVKPRVEIIWVDVSVNSTSMTNQYSVMKVMIVLYIVVSCGRVTIFYVQTIMGEIEN
jgi:hypothetical protein